MQWSKAAAVSGLFLVIAAAAQLSGPSAQFQFALLGDRTGEAQSGVYEEAWSEAIANHPAFVLTVGDTIQGGDDNTVTSEWQRVFRILAPYRTEKLFLTPGNHDVWSSASAKAYEQYSGHPLHYSFDWQQAHFTVLDDSESDRLSENELTFLEQDLSTHSSQPVKFIISHRPAWLFPVVLGDTSFPLHKLARKFGVQYVIAGHIHQMMHFELDGITYLSMASSGGHLRNDRSYEHGWFFQQTLVSVSGSAISLKINELKAPYGRGRITTPADWGASGLK